VLREEKGERVFAHTFIMADGMPIMAGGMPFVFKILLVVATILVLRELRRRDARAGREQDAEALALLEEVRASMDRLEERVGNLETLLPDPGKKEGAS
jgi:phage shock protein B